MDKEKHPQRIPIQPPIISYAWIKNQFDELHKEHALILKRIDELSTVCKAILVIVQKDGGSPPPPIPPHFDFAVGQVNNKQ